jgi:hypothetical protein
MGTRRDDIPVTTRMQIVQAMNAPQRPQGTVRRVAQLYGLSRQAVYDLAAHGTALLAAGLRPRPHGPVAVAPTLTVDRNRLLRALVTLTAVGVSQRDIQTCLAELLDSDVSLGWVNARLIALEGAAAAINVAGHPQSSESLAADELFAYDLAHLLVIGNDSLFIYALQAAAHRDGATWAALWRAVPGDSPVATDGGSGLAAGLAAVGRTQQELDWDHLLRPLWQQATVLERRAYALLTELEERSAAFAVAHSEKRLAGHLRRWEHLQAQAAAAITAYDRFAAVARAIDAEFAMIDLASGQVADPAAGQARLQALGAQLTALGGVAAQKLGTQVSNWAAGLLRYRPRLAAALGALAGEWGRAGVAALSRVWQVEATERRGHLGVQARQALEQVWQASLAAAGAALGPAWEAAWGAVAEVLGQIWRGSMVAESLNSQLRQQVTTHKTTSQGFLELFRFLHNTQRIARGKHAGQIPAELVGLTVPADRLTLLGLSPKV